MSDENKKQDNDNEVYDASTGSRHCTACGARNSRSSQYCQSCGKSLSTEEIAQRRTDQMLVKCPKCKSTQVELVTHQQSSDFSSSKACCGFALCGPLGILFGLDGNKTPARTFRKCKNCGNEF